ncbi:MAG: hypothetical protein ACLPTM_03960 [Steroidobacteraceae bacterium]
MPIHTPARGTAVVSRLARAALPALVLAGMLASPRARAEELTVLAGVTDSDDHTSGTYAWGLEYRQQLLTDLDTSFGYLNEGHLPGHFRDGAVLQLWGHTLWRQRVDLALGAGPYIYCDTQTYPNGGERYSNYHSVGAIVTGSLSYTLSRDWFARLELSEVIAPGNVATRTVMLGLGYRLQPFIDALSHSAQDLPRAADPDAANELGVFYGQTIIDGQHADASAAFGVEYRRRVGRHFELSASVIDDGDGLDGRHAGMTGEAWIVQDFLSRQLVVGLGLGAYLGFESYQTIYHTTAASAVGLVSMTASWRFTRSLALRLVWHRGVTGDDQDRDVVTLGLGWRF